MIARIRFVFVSYQAKLEVGQTSNASSDPHRLHHLSSDLYLLLKLNSLTFSPSLTSISYTDCERQLEATKAVASADKDSLDALKLFAPKRPNLEVA